MIPMKFIRENPQLVRDAIRDKCEKRGNVDRLLELDEQSRQLTAVADELKNQRNLASREIGRLQKANEDASESIAAMQQVSARVKELDSELRDLDSELQEELLYIPNLPHPEVPVGTSEADNREVSLYGEPRLFDFEPLDHLQLSERHRLLDMLRGAKITGSGFPLYRGDGARLERALINFMLDLHTREHGFEEVFTPFVANADAMRGTGQIPKLVDDMYHIGLDDLYLIPTAEVTITNIFQGEILTEQELPQSLAGYSACFRREAGSYGKDNRGLLRVHQFNKVEMVKLVKPEESEAELELLRSYAEKVLQLLGIHYRVVELCTADLSFAAARCYDLEAWAPGEGKFLEVSSCSNFLDFQARRANIRYRDTTTGKVCFVHTLNGSGLATSRLLVALIETWQNRNGTITIPEALRPWFDGRETIG
ncbi:serine--tRNA ligase [bacterium]|nr:serine--tRNA ligase [bacterium]